MAKRHAEKDRDASLSVVSSQETIVRRLPPRPDTTIDRPGIGVTATSFSIEPRPGEDFPSWSRRKITSPEALLAIEESKGRDVTGWHVCEVAVQIVRDLGLDVVAAPNEEDEGHCLIQPSELHRFSTKIWKKLARQTRVIYTKPAYETR